MFLRPIAGLARKGDTSGLSPMFCIKVRNKEYCPRDLKCSPFVRPTRSSPQLVEYGGGGGRFNNSTLSCSTPPPPPPPPPPLPPPPPTAVILWSLTSAVSYSKTSEEPHRTRQQQGGPQHATHDDGDGRCANPAVHVRGGVGLDYNCHRGRVRALTEPRDTFSRVDRNALKIRIAGGAVQLVGLAGVVFGRVAEGVRAAGAEVFHVRRQIRVRYRQVDEVGRVGHVNAWLVDERVRARPYKG
ncbi:hypothetical protein BC936DRAFT_146355 [Jimgerdemannia flammicorona]|uniref:Uncharacterized protein n=1 Tax=Jimgerdemannia flammicorona TaxID=994334 RepID=A0A433D7U4_9FUNG|nr:hypothetical protein BC936DRAFT_146355 [Jimgerdemannia flammicorona]